MWAFHTCTCPLVTRFYRGFRKYSALFGTVYFLFSSLPAEPRTITDRGWPRGSSVASSSLFWELEPVDSHFLPPRRTPAESISNEEFMHRAVLQYPRRLLATYSVDCGSQGRGSSRLRERFSGIWSSWLSSLHAGAFLHQRPSANAPLISNAVIARLFPCAALSDEVANTTMKTTVVTLTLFHTRARLQQSHF